MAIIEGTTIPEVRDAGLILVDYQADARVREEAWYREKQMRDEASLMDEAREEGEAQGLAKGRLETLVEFVRDGLVSIEEAARRAGLSVAKFEELMKPQSK